MARMSICAGGRRSGHQVGKQVLGVEDADDVVEVLLVDRDARVPGLHDHAEHLVDRVAHLDRLDPDARHHHLVHLGLGQLDDPVDHLLLVLFDASLLAPRLDEHLQLLGRQVAGLGPILAPQGAHQDVRDGRYEPHNRAQRTIEPADRARHEEGEAVREGERQRLRHQLADDDRRQCDEQRHDHEADLVGGILDEGQRDQLDHPGEAAGERHGAKGGGEEAEEGERDLDRGQEAARVLGQVLGHSCRAVPLADQLVEPMALDGDQGDLAGREEAPDRDERQYDGHVQDRVAGAASAAAFRHARCLVLRPAWGGAVASRCCAPACRPPSRRPGRRASPPRRLRCARRGRC